MVVRIDGIYPFGLEKPQLPMEDPQAEAKRFVHSYSERNPNVASSRRQTD
jgi:hypothetical protein